MLTNKRPTMSKTIPTQEALAYAFAAYRIRKGYQKHTQRYSEDKPTEHSNKEMLKMHFGEYKDKDFVDFSPVAEDYDSVDIARTHFKRYSMLLLGDDLNQFQRDVFHAVTKDEVPFNVIGLVAYVPALVKREVEEAKFKKLLRIDYRDSKHLGSPKEAVEGVIKFLSKFYSEQWESYNYIADLDGNLVSFMNKFEYDIGDRKRLTGKVKGHQKNRSFDVNETRLNYVKMYKV